MWVIVRVEGRYNNPRHRAQYARPGDRIQVADGPYAQSLIEDGLVVPAYSEPPGPDTGPSEARRPGPMETLDVQGPMVGDLTVEVIHGIGSTIARRLTRAGILTVADLAGMTPEYVAEVARISEARARALVERAQSMVE